MPYDPAADVSIHGDLAVKRQAPDQAGSISMTAKVEVLVDELRKMRLKNPKAKALVFSQFVHSMSFIAEFLTKAGFAHRSLDGAMTAVQRKNALDRFRDDDDLGVLLLSIRAGAVGLTLVSATHVFLMEPCLNPALEAQVTQARFCFCLILSIQQLIFCAL